LLAGIDLLTGRVRLSLRIATAAANSSNFSSFSTPPYPAHTAIRLILLDKSFRSRFQQDKGLARQSSGRPFRNHLHAQGRLLAHPCRGLLLQARPLGRAPDPRCIQTRAQAPHHGPMDEFNRHRVVYIWSYKLDQVA
jgi:hypothetical protein